MSEAKTPATFAGAVNPAAGPSETAPPAPPVTAVLPPAVLPKNKKGSPVYEVVFRHVPFAKKKLTVNAGSAEEALEWAVEALRKERDPKQVDLFNGWLALVRDKMPDYASVRKV